MLDQSVQVIAHSLRFFGAFAIAPAASFEAGFGGGVRCGPLDARAGEVLCPMPARPHRRVLRASPWPPVSQQ